MRGQTFGEYFKEMRMRKNMTLRQFCIENDFDPGNISKLERGRLNPPTSNDVLKKYAHALEIKEGTDEWTLFFDLASAASGRIPSDVMSNEELVAALPLVFRTIRGEKITEENLHKIAEVIKNG